MLVFPIKLNIKRWANYLLLGLCFIVPAAGSCDPFGKAEVKPYVPVTLYGKVRIGEVAASEGDVVAVWVGDEMRGKVQIQFVVGGVAYLTLPIYAEQDGEKTNRFKLWDQSSGELYELGKVMELSIGGTIGSAQELVELDFGGGGDGVAPVIELLGEAQVTVELGSEYEDEGGKATDVVEGDLSGSIVVVNNVDTARPGTYRVSYNVQDSAGNAAAEVVRVVVVKPRLVETLSLDVVQRKPFTFRFTTQIGVLYKVEVSEDLQKWIKVKEINGTDGIVQFTDDRNINESAQFYRLRMQ